MKRGLSADSADETDFKSQISNLKWEHREPPQMELIPLHSFLTAKNSKGTRVARVDEGT